jgi:hypothetical protein
MKSIVSLCFCCLLFNQAVLSQTLSDGEYMIKVNRTDRYMAIEGAAAQNGAKAVQWDMEVQSHFLFIVKYLGNGLYSIMSKKSGRFLSSDGESPKEGAKIIQWDWLNQDNQKWYITPAENGAKGWRLRCFKNYMRVTMQFWNTTTATPANGAEFRLTRDEIAPAMLLDFKKNETLQVINDDPLKSEGRNVPNVLKPQTSKIKENVQDDH